MPTASVTDLAQLYDYNYWATKRVLRAAAQLSPEHFTQEIAGAYGSVRNTLVHVLSAEWGWLDRSGGLPRGARLKPEDFPTVESVVVIWNRVEEHMREFISNVSADDFERVVEFSFGGPKQALSVGEMLTHAAIHGAHHRGQLAMLLRALGAPAGDFDFVFYADERRAALTSPRDP